ncbi:hypothetical protein [Kitasatospora sp. NPDC050463]
MGRLVAPEDGYAMDLAVDTATAMDIEAGLLEHDRIVTGDRQFAQAA